MKDCARRGQKERPPPATSSDGLRQRAQADVVSRRFVLRSGVVRRDLLFTVRQRSTAIGARAIVRKATEFATAFVQLVQSALPTPPQKQHDPPAPYTSFNGHATFTIAAPEVSSNIHRRVIALLTPLASREGT